LKVPKTTTRFCPKCNKRTGQKIDLVSTGFKRGTLTRGSISRTKKRGVASGKGNKGKYSRKAIKSWKRKSKTTTRKVLIYKCDVCKKSTLGRSRRVSKLLIGEK